MKERKIPSGETNGDTPKSVASLDTILLMDLQNLVNHCAVTRYDSGAPRVPGWLLIKTVGSIWSVSVKDPDSCLQVASVGMTIDEALTTANVLVAADNGPWEVDRYLERRPGKKRN